MSFDLKYAFIVLALIKVVLVNFIGSKEDQVTKSLWHKEDLRPYSKCKYNLTKLVFKYLKPGFKCKKKV